MPLKTSKGSNYACLVGKHDVTPAQKIAVSFYVFGYPYILANKTTNNNSTFQIAV